MLEIVYTGSIEATMEEMRRMLILAHSLYISVPVTIIVIILYISKTTVSWTNESPHTGESKTLTGLDEYCQRHFVAVMPP